MPVGFSSFRSLHRARALAARLAACAALSASLAPLGGETVEPKTALGYTANAKHAYEEAMKEFTAHDWIEAVTAMREVKRKYSYSKYARLAELRIADCDFMQEKYADA